MSARWYVVVTRSRHEKRVAQLLKNMGFEIYLPLRRTKSKRRDRQAEVDLPAIPQYLFVKCVMNRGNSAKIKPIYGVVGLVEFADQPVAIPDEQIESFKLVIERANDRWILGESLQKGDKVRVKRGPLHGAVGYLSESSQRYELRILVENVPYSLTIEVDIADVEKIIA